jgi:predicted nucleotidyltransferase
MPTAPVPPELLDPAVAYFKLRRVIVFGSVARGDAGPDSDIDLLVVVDDDTPPERLTIRAGIESRMSYRHPADVIPWRESTFRRKARIAGTLAYEAAHAGTVIYERP